MAEPKIEHHHAQQPSPSQTLPSIAALTNGLPSSNQYSPQNRQPSHLPSRDSGTWPPIHPQMKPVESYMNNPSLQVSTLLNPEDPQSRNSIPNTPTSNRLSQHQQQSNTILPSINQTFDVGNRGSVDYHQSLDSRRSSIDSRVHTGISNLGLNNPTSPYESQNGSQVSLAASLRRPNNGNPLSPLSGRNSIRGGTGPRVAPPIVGASRVPGAPDPMASKPTPGHAWAFPDDPIAEESRRESSSEDSQRHSISRTNSYAASSIRSSIFSQNEGLPYGQRRFDDDALTHHHHSMSQHRVSALQNEANLPGGGNYSRTPELRISHKLAERKRRSEMKDLFEELNRAVPTNGGAKASKWEILTKAIEYIKNTQTQERGLLTEVHRLREASDYAREAQSTVDNLQTEIAVMQERLRLLEPGNPHIYGAYTSKLSQANAQAQANGQSRQFSLPSMNVGPPPPQHYNAPGTTSQGMQGVEYGSASRHH
ncbi:hypothetical protein E4T42_02126 [Aureobasidium subglaciale]|nr:hypothetical protein E4T42_02126 [Aureobasidium subglaciale]